MNNLVDETLDCTVPMSDQVLAKVQKVRNLVRPRFPSSLPPLNDLQAVAKYKFLDDYKDNWAVNDFIKARLKVRKAHLYKEGLEKVVAEVQKNKSK